MFMTGLLLADLLASVSWYLYVTAQYDYTSINKTDAVIILMGDFNGSFTAPGRRTLRRLNHALSLYRHGASMNFLCAGGSRPRDNIYGAELMQQYLVKNGIPANNIFVEKHSYDSHTNWANSLRVITEQDWKTIQIISSPLHLYRFPGLLERTPHALTVLLSPFPYAKAIPEISYLELWLNIHYNWAVNFSYLLPKPVYDKILDLIRPQ